MKSLFKKIVSFGSLYLITPLVTATVLSPNPNGSNEEHWDSILGSGSFDNYALVMRLIPTILLLISSAWAIFGLFRATFSEGALPPIDFALYSARLLLIITIAISLIFT